MMLPSGAWAFLVMASNTPHRLTCSVPLVPFPRSSLQREAYTGGGGRRTSHCRGGLAARGELEPAGKVGRDVVKD
jgi:hypothetical protein